MGRPEMIEENHVPLLLRILSIWNDSSWNGCFVLEDPTFTVACSFVFEKERKDGLDHWPRLRRPR